MGLVIGKMVGLLVEVGVGFEISITVGVGVREWAFGVVADEVGAKLALSLVSE